MNLAGLLFDVARRLPERPAVSDERHFWTYRELAEPIACLSGGLRAHGLRPGDRVLLCLENCAEFVELLPIEDWNFTSSGEPNISFSDPVSSSRTVRVQSSSLGPALLANDATVTLYVAAILARRLDIANQALIEVKRQLQVGDPRRVIGNTVEKAEQLLMSGGVSLVRRLSLRPVRNQINRFAADSLQKGTGFEHRSRESA